MDIAFVPVTLPIIQPATLLSRKVARLGSHAVRPSVPFILALWNGFAILFFHNGILTHSQYFPCSVSR